MRNFKIKNYFNPILFLFALSLGNPVFAESFFNPSYDIIKEGNNLFNNQEYKKALNQFKKADEEFPNDPRLEFNKGTAIAKDGNPIESIPYFEKALQSKDSSLRSKTYFNMGKAYESTQNTKKAIESYRKALQEDPENFNARKNLELMYNPKKNQDPSKSSQNQDSDPNNNNSNPFSPNSSQHQEPQDPKKSKKENDQAPSSSESRDNKNSLTKDEAERIMESLNADRVQRKNSKSLTPFRRDKFW